MKHITIGIITYNGQHRANDCLRSIEKWRDVPEDTKIDFLLVDDGTPEPNCQATTWLSRHWNIPVIFHKENLGISKSWNDICRYGNSDYIVLLNDDILVSKNWLTCGLYFLENNPCAGTVGWNFYFIIPSDIPQIFEAEKPLHIPRDPHSKAIREDYVIGDRPGRVGAPPGSCFMFSRENYDIIGGFDENFKSFYEESTFGLELLRNGLPSYTLPYPYLYHLWAATFHENAATLKPAIRIENSREYFRKKYNVGEEFTFPEKEVHKEFMSKVEPAEVTWLDRKLQPKRDIIG